MKKTEVIVLAFVAGGVATYALMRMGVFTGPAKLGSTAPYHNYLGPNLQPQFSAALKIF